MIKIILWFSFSIFLIHMHICIRITYVSEEGMINECPFSLNIFIVAKHHPLTSSETRDRREKLWHVLTLISTSIRLHVWNCEYLYLILLLMKEHFIIHIIRKLCEAHALIQFLDEYNFIKYDSCLYNKYYLNEN